MRAHHQPKVSAAASARLAACAAPDHPYRSGCAPCCARTAAECSSRASHASSSGTPPCASPTKQQPGAAPSATQACRNAVQSAAPVARQRSACVGGGVGDARWSAARWHERTTRTPAALHLQVARTSSRRYINQPASRPHREIVHHQAYASRKAAATAAAAAAGHCHRKPLMQSRQRGRRPWCRRSHQGQQVDDGQAVSGHQSCQVEPGLAQHGGVVARRLRRRQQHHPAGGGGACRAGRASQRQPEGVRDQEGARRVRAVLNQHGRVQVRLCQRLHGASELQEVRAGSAEPRESSCSVLGRHAIAAASPPPGGQHSRAPVRVQGTFPHASSHGAKLGHDDYTCANVVHQEKAVKMDRSMQRLDGGRRERGQARERRDGIVQAIRTCILRVIHGCNSDPGRW